MPSANPIETRRKELPALTGLRFIAASLVFLAHITKIPGMGWLEQFWIFQLGSFGVAVFFVLSGFILTYNYSGTFEHGISVASCGRFLWDRFARIYPLYLLTLFAAIPIQVAARHRTWDWEALCVNLTLTQCILPVDKLKLSDYFNVPAWSISCEALFYALAPALIWMGAMAGRWVRFLLFGLVVIVFLSASLALGVEEFLWPARFALVRVPEFVTGVLAGRIFLESRAPSGVATRLLVVLGVALIGVAFAINPTLPVFLKSGPLCAPGAALLVYGLAQNEGVLARVLSTSLFSLLGGASFAFYLIHDLGIRISRGALIHFGIVLDGFWHSMLFMLVSFMALQIVSVLTFKAIELPAQRFLRTLIRKPKARDVSVNAVKETAEMS